MSLTKLIQDQTIMIDDHQRGNREMKNFDSHSSDIHLDKKTNFKIDGKYQDITIKISLNSDRKPLIKLDNKNKKLDEIPRKLRTEIKDALEDNDIAFKFFKDIEENIRNYPSLLEDKKKCIYVFDRIAKYFELEKIGEDIFNINKSYEAKYIAEDNRIVKTKMGKNKIVIGEDNGISQSYFDHI